MPAIGLRNATLRRESESRKGKGRCGWRLERACQDADFSCPELSRRDSHSRARPSGERAQQSAMTETACGRRIISIPPVIGSAFAIDLGERIHRFAVTVAGQRAACAELVESCPDWGSLGILDNHPAAKNRRRIDSVVTGESERSMFKLSGDGGIGDRRKELTYSSLFVSS